MADHVLHTLVRAEARFLWHTLLDSLERPQEYLPDLREWRVEKTAVDAYVREFQVRGVRCQETISVNDAAREMYGEFRDGYGCAGRMTIKVVPTSVQNPMAPVDLQYFVDLDPNGPRDKILDALREEQVRVKEASEEMEQRELMSSQGDRRFHHPS